MSTSGGLPFHSSSSAVERRFLCSSCHFLLVEPKFIKCSHRYCSLCLEKLMNSRPSAICCANGCDEVISNDEIYPDLPTENELKCLISLVCHNKPNGCLWKGNYVTYKDHLQTCTFEDLRCESCSLSFPNRSLFAQHSSLCPKALVLCPFNKFGCLIQVSREGLHDHLLSSAVNHAQSLTDVVSSLQNQTKPVSLPLNQTFSISENSEVKSLRNELIQQTQIIEQLRVEQRSLLSRLNKCEQDANRACVGVQLSKGESCQLRKEFELSKTLVHNDGSYLWRIDNIQEVFHNAKNTPEPIYLTSRPFYTSKYGYKLSLRLYLNGDKSVRDTHLSLYVTVMRGDYDALLNWPFKYRITLCLYDRSSKQDHVVHTITPDINSECFQQPKMLDCNKSGGIPAFCPLWKVFSKDFGYVSGSTMFIKAIIDFNIYPATIWPHWTKLQSHGLPVNVEYIKLNQLLDNEK